MSDDFDDQIDELNDSFFIVQSSGDFSLNLMALRQREEDIFILLLSLSGIIHLCNKEF